MHVADDVAARLYEYAPALHATQVPLDVAAAIDEYVPWTQLVHVAATAADHEPALQLVQVVEPADENVPPLQPAQVLARADDHVPELQFRHVKEILAPSVVENCPAAHPLHTCDDDAPTSVE